MFPLRVFQLSPRRARDNVLLFSLALWFTPTTLFGSDVLVRCVYRYSARFALVLVPSAKFHQ